MYLTKSNEELVSDFITGTCQLLQRQHYPSSDHTHDVTMTWESQTIEYATVSGSGVEFYIRPLNTCIGDLDYLVCMVDQLAFSGDFPVVPSDISGLADAIHCYEIEPCHGFPGFIRLRDFGEMTYNWKHKKYKLKRNITPGIYVKIDRTQYFYSSVDRFYGELDEPMPKTFSGPAIKSPSEVSDFVHATGIDAVHCLRCPQWPRDSQMWPLRTRNNGWPTSETISEVVRNGCHVVYAQHRACRGDELQWRLSFSIAEVILLHSWTKTQQIVYHLLRFFAKRELIKEDCPKEDEVLCPYHLKTLMLWTCEKMSPEWWDSSPVIAICCELLNILSDWLKRRLFPNYFIREANLFHHPSTSTLLHQTERRVNDFRNYGILCRWFIDNYILPTIRTQFQFLNTRKVTPDFMDYMLPLLDYRKAAMPIFAELAIASKFYKCNAFYHIAIKTNGLLLRQLLRIQETVGNSHFIMVKAMTCYPPIEKVLRSKYYDFILFSLQFAYYLTDVEISWNCSPIVEFVNSMSLQPKIIRSQYHSFPKTYRAEGSRYQCMRALRLMENLTGLNSRSQFQLMSVISKEFLRRTLEADGSESNGVATAALIYLAALNFASSEYQEAIRLCSAVLVDRTPQEEKETLNAGGLLFIDDVARIVGFCILHKKITEVNLNYIGRRLYLDLRLSPEVFAHYLTVSSSEKGSTHLNFGRNLPDPSFSVDNNVRALIKPKFIAKMKLGSQRNDASQIVYRRIASLAEAETTATNPSIVKEKVIDLLMEIALENMTSFYRMILKDIGIQCNTADCYRDLYLYKRLQYDEVLYVCERILNEPDLQGDIKELSFANVLVMPPIDSFFDGDVQSLLGFHTLFYYLNDNLHTSNLTNNSTFEHWFINDVKFKNSRLDECFAERYSIKCHYFLGRHFLARYLKVRCYIDCSFPYKEAMTEFSAQATNLPFERIIRRFLLRRHRNIKHFRLAKE